ncbi:MAG: hypothetical protein AB7U71_05830 [Comamonas sp.]
MSQDLSEIPRENNPEAKNIKTSGAYSPLLAKLVSDALLLGVLSAFGYCIAFTYEMGYAKHFGYPSYLISPTPSVIVTALAAVAGLFMSVAPFFSDLFKFDDEFNKKVSVIFAFVVLVILLAIHSFTVSNYSWVALARTLGFMAFIMGMTYLQTRINKKKGSVTSPGVAKFFFLASALAGIYLVSIIAGIYSAKGEKVFYFLKDRPDYAVVRLYDSTAIAVRFDKQKQLFDHRYNVIKIGDDKNELDLTRVVLKEKRLPVVLDED